MSAITSPPTASGANTPPINAKDLFTFPAEDIDTTVTYEGELITGKVASNALVLASPVWAKFVHPPFPRSTDTPISDSPPSAIVNDEGVIKQKAAGGGAGNTTDRINTENNVASLDFKEDDAEALLILLQISHLQFTEIPSTLLFKKFLNLAILCD